MTTPEERATERDIQQHESSHPGCNERYWRERALRAEKAIVRAVLDEREACAKIVEDYQECDYAASLAPFVAKYGTEELAAAIRARR